MDIAATRDCRHEDSRSGPANPASTIDSPRLIFGRHSSDTFKHFMP